MTTGATNKWRIVVFRKAYDRHHSVMSRDIIHMESGYYAPNKLGQAIQDALDLMRPKVNSLEDLEINVVCLEHRSRSWSG